MMKVETNTTINGKIVELLLDTGDCKIFRSNVMEESVTMYVVIGEEVVSEVHVLAGCGGEGCGFISDVDAEVVI